MSSTRLPVFCICTHVVGSSSLCATCAEVAAVIIWNLQEYILQCKWVSSSATATEVSWMVAHRYSDFDELHDKVHGVALRLICLLPPIPRVVSVNVRRACAQRPVFSLHATPACSCCTVHIAPFEMFNTWSICPQAERIMLLHADQVWA